MGVAGGCRGTQGKGVGAPPERRGTRKGEGAQVARGPPGSAHTRRPGIVRRGRCRLPPAAAFRKLLRSLMLPTRR
jgi:hypothetical protein